MKHSLAFTVILVTLLRVAASGDDIRYYEENGQTYRETRRVVQRPVADIVHQPVNRTVYRDQYKTEYQNSVRVYSTPVTEYRWESYWRGRWNPFVQPFLDQRLVPYTRWETRTENVQVPVVRREVVAETQQEHVPVVTQRMVNEEQVSRVAVGAAATGGYDGNPTAQIAQRPIGGINRLDSSPPRQGTDDAWKPTQGSTLR